MIYCELFISFLRVGLFSFGGAYGAIPLIREEVLRRGWLSDEALSYMIAVSESTPGPIMVNTATYIGSAEKCHQKSSGTGPASWTASLCGGHYSGHRY